MEEDDEEGITISTRNLPEDNNKTSRKAQEGTYSRGQIYHVSQGTTTGSEQAGGRPAVIVSNDNGNTHSTVVEVVFLTTKKKHWMPTHVPVRSAQRPSTALCEQIQTVDKERLLRYIGNASEQEMRMINRALAVSLGLSWENKGRAIKKKAPGKHDEKHIHEKEWHLFDKEIAGNMGVSAILSPETGL